MKKRLVVGSLATFLLLVFTSPIKAQNPSTGQIVVTVIDPSGTVIPGARIRILELGSALPKDTDWFQFAIHAPEQASVNTDAAGKAVIDLTNGSYVIAISALGFQRYFERIEIRDEASRTLHATLRIGNSCSPCLVVEREIPFPLEHAPAPYIFIPFEEFQTINLPAVPVRRRWLWF